MTEPTKLSEAVARAIHEAGHGVPPGDWDETVSCGELNWEVDGIRHQARAAIRAVLEGIMEPGVDALIPGHNIADVGDLLLPEFKMAYQATLRHIIERECGPAPSCKPQRREVI